VRDWPAPEMGKSRQRAINPGVLQQVRNSGAVGRPCKHAQRTIRVKSQTAIAARALLRIIARALDNIQCAHFVSPTRVCYSICCDESGKGCFVCANTRSITRAPFFPFVRAPATYVAHMYVRSQKGANVSDNVKRHTVSSTNKEHFHFAGFKQ
jgi:hypothetical protein